MIVSVSPQGMKGEAEQFLVPRPSSGVIEPDFPWKWSLIELNRA